MIRGLRFPPLHARQPSALASRLTPECGNREYELRDLEALGFVSEAEGPDQPSEFGLSQGHDEMKPPEGGRGEKEPLGMEVSGVPRPLQACAKLKLCTCLLLLTIPRLGPLVKCLAEGTERFSLCECSPAMPKAWEQLCPGDIVKVMLQGSQREASELEPLSSN
ncbi:39S Ribosomal Protein L40 [Manis pentadactyla]|nr:39S Ribosomal Protein L40 [Manis pentadactyla]